MKEPCLIADIGGTNVKTLVTGKDAPRRFPSGRKLTPDRMVEEVLAGESPKACAERLAKDKALAVAKVRRADWVLGADTVVAVEGEILGKPADAADAGRMLRLLSGHTAGVVMRYAAPSLRPSNFSCDVSLTIVASRPTPKREVESINA